MRLVTLVTYASSQWEGVAVVDDEPWIWAELWSTVTSFHSEQDASGNLVRQSHLHHKDNNSPSLPIITSVLTADFNHALKQHWLRHTESSKTIGYPALSINIYSLSQSLTLCLVVHNWPQIGARLLVLWQIDNDKIWHIKSERNEQSGILLWGALLVE